MLVYELAIVYDHSSAGIVAFRVSVTTAVSRSLQGSGVSNTFSASDVTRVLGPGGE